MTGLPLVRNTIQIQFASHKLPREIAGHLTEDPRFDLVADLLTPSNGRRFAGRLLITQSYAPATVSLSHSSSERTVVLFRGIKTRAYYVKDYRRYGGVPVFIKSIVTPDQPLWFRQIFWAMKNDQWSYQKRFQMAGFACPKPLLRLATRDRRFLLFASEYLQSAEMLTSVSGERSENSIARCVAYLHRLVDLGTFPAMLRLDELLQLPEGEDIFITDTSVGIWPVFRCLLPLMVGMETTKLLASFPVQKVLTAGYFNCTSWKPETEVLKGFLRSLPARRRKLLLHAAIDAWGENAACEKWASAESCLAEEEALLLRSFPQSAVADRLRAGHRLPL